MAKQKLTTKQARKEETMEVEKMMDTLQKQLQLLSKRAQKTQSVRELAKISDSMANIAMAIAHLAGQIRFFSQGSSGLASRQTSKENSTRSHAG